MPRSILQGDTQGLPDVEAMVDMLAGRRPLPAEADRLFDADRPITLARAPGRLDVMGGIADYSGSLVLEMPTREAACAALQLTADRTLRLVSPGGDDAHRTSAFSMPLEALLDVGDPIDYAEARRRFAADPKRHWAAYVAGVVLVLMREKQIPFDHGLALLIRSDVPEGKGVSSSAALEVAVMQAVNAALGLDLAPAELARLCQIVENQVVGAPCGIMDQMTSSCGEAGALLQLLCQPAELRDPVALPDGVDVWGIDSGIRHAVTGADYGSVRIGAFAGLELIRRMDPDQADTRYLAEITPERFEARHAPHLPERLDGATLLDRLGDWRDPATEVDPERAYAVRTPTAHPIYEHDRVQRFAALLQREPIGEVALRELGSLMLGSHASYSACGLGSDGTDRLVELVRDAGPAKGLFGAKITGGGSGGTVAILGRSDTEPVIHDLAGQYAAETGRPAYVFTGASPGAAAFGAVHLGPAEPAR